MAVTRIWPIKNNIHQVVSYAANKSKTDLSKYSDLVSSLHYAADKDKKNLESEQRLLVDGINCDPDIAAQQMIDKKKCMERWEVLVPITHIFLLNRERLLPKKHSRLQWRLQIKCGELIMRWLLPPT